MNRRGFFAALSALGATLTLGMTKRESEIRFVEFNPPNGETCAIYWSDKHMPAERFVGNFELLALSMQPEQVKTGYAMMPLLRRGMYLSDTPQPNFEPITYWIPADHFEQEVAA